MTRTRSLIALALVTSMLLAGCGKDDKQSASKPKNLAEAKQQLADAAKAANAEAATPDPEAAATNEETAAPAGEPAPAGSDPAPAPNTPAASALDPKVFEGDYVFGKPQPRSIDDPRPLRCEFKVDQPCLFRVAGTYGLKSAQVANIAVGMYENDATTPSFESTLPGAKQGSSRWYIDNYAYKAKPGVTHVDFLIKLLDPTGTELARSQPIRFTIQG